MKKTVDEQTQTGVRRIEVREVKKAVGSEGKVGIRQVESMRRSFNLETSKKRTRS